MRHQQQQNSFSSKKQQLQKIKHMVVFMIYRHPNIPLLLDCDVKHKNLLLEF